MDATAQSPTASSPKSPAATSPLLAGGPPSPTAASPLLVSGSGSGSKATSSSKSPVPVAIAATDERRSTEQRPSTTFSHETMSSRVVTESSELTHNSPSLDLSRQSPDMAAAPSSSTLGPRLRPQPTPEAGSSSTRRHSQNSTFMLAQHRLSRASSIGADSRYPVPLSPGYEFGMLMGGSGGSSSPRNSVYATAQSRNSFYAAGSSSRPQSMISPTRRDSSYNGYFPPAAQPGTSSQPHAVTVSSPLAGGEARNSLRHSIAYPLSSSPTPPDTPRAGGERFNSETPTPVDMMSPLGPPTPFYAHQESGSESSRASMVFMPYTDEAEPDDELHTPEKLDTKGRPPGNPLKWSSRGFCNIATVLIATVGLLVLFVVYPITNFLGYNERIHSMEGLGLSIGDNAPKFNATGQLDLSGSGSNNGNGGDTDTTSIVDPNTTQPVPEAEPSPTTATETDPGTTTSTEAAAETSTGAEPIINPDTGNEIDPTTGRDIDPVTGLQIDPATGWLIDEATGFPIDPATGLPTDPATGLPVTPAVRRLRFLRLAR